MKCIQCGSEWSVSDKLKSNIKKCPFCNADLYINKPQEIVDVLIEWGNKEGIDFFKNSMKISSLLADFFPNKVRERNAIKIALEKGIGSQIVQLHYEDDESIKLIRINQMKRVLLEDAWLSESATDFVMSTLITASDMVDKHAKRNEELLVNKKTKKKLGEAGETKIDKVVAQIVEKKELNDDLELVAVISAAIAAYEGSDSTDGFVVKFIQQMEQSQEVASQQDKKLENSIQDQITELMESGKKYEAAGEIDAALVVYKKAADRGNAEAAYRIAKIISELWNDLASRYYYGTGVSVNYKKAFECYTKAAGQGHSEAQNSLGYMYEHGEGTAKDLKKALYWYEKSAQNGNRNAQSNLAFFYYSGTGVPVNYKKAFEWFTKAADQGHSGAQNNLGVMYEYGYEVEKNLTEAVKWYKKASENGNEDGRDNYKRCIKLV